MNDTGYRGPLSVEWEDGRMDRVHGATESCAFVRQLDFTPNQAAFDAAFSRRNKFRPQFTPTKHRSSNLSVSFAVCFGRMNSSKASAALAVARASFCRRAGPFPAGGKTSRESKLPGNFRESTNTPTLLPAARCRPPTVRHGGLTLHQPRLAFAFTTSPMTPCLVLLRADEFQHGVRLVHRHDGHHADAHVEDLIQFHRPARRFFLFDDLKMGSMSHEPLRMTTSQFLRQARAGCCPQNRRR